MSKSDRRYFQRIMVTGSSAVLGSGLKAIQQEFPGSEFLFLTSKDCNLTDPEVTLETVRQLQPDAILHLAAVSGGIGLSMKHQASMLRDNTLMTFAVLEAARKCSVEKTVMTLTTGMYPPHASLPLNEDNIHDGYPHESNYGSSFAKRLIDPAIRAYREDYDMNIIGLIPSGIFGENDNFNTDDAPMLPSLMRRFYENKDSGDPLVVWGDGKPLREYTYSQDLARIYMWALEQYDAAQCLNIGTTEEHSIKDIAHMIAQIMGIDLKRIQFDTNKPGGVYRKNTDNSRFIRLSGFQYTPFRVALEKTIHWFVDAYESHPESIRMYSKSKQK
jgi:GDP-L-fucose synthase